MLHLVSPLMQNGDLVLGLKAKLRDGDESGGLALKVADWGVGRLVFSQGGALNSCCTITRTSSDRGGKCALAGNA